MGCGHYREERNGVQPIRLGVNIDHVATLRNARGGAHPDPIAAALAAMDGGADGITAHLREDRRHIREADMFALKAEVPLPLNFEMAATEEMLALALRVKPNACCLVPEKRQELTTEGGLNVAGQEAALTSYVAQLKEAGLRVSLFINADVSQAEASARVGADIVEFHTGRYCEEMGEARTRELERLRRAVAFAHALGLECHAGHGLSYDTVEAVAALPEVVELNIGHFLIAQAVFEGLAPAVRRMKTMIMGARV
jgi:pyridoxine 5-phosphate synthase